MGATCLAEAAGNLGKYTLYAKVGEGYLGPVYRAFDPDLGHAVAIRIVSDAVRWDTEVEARLHQECQAAAGLQHPNIARLFVVGAEGPSHYVVTELLESRNLATLIAQKSDMPWETKVSIMIKAAEGLSYAHRNGVLHRNLRPSQIHLGADGSIKIRDFGIAHVLLKYLTHPSVRWGTPIYMSPEQVQLKECTEQSDMFSAGIIFYELLTFFHPFHDRNSNKTLDNILFTTEVPTFEQFPQVPPGIWLILKKCLAKDPNDRYGTMEECADACRGFLNELTEESQLMLSELHAILPRLRKAALQPDAPESITKLLHAVQNLTLSGEYADYAFLDRLMTDLIDHYPAIQAVSGPIPVPEILYPAFRSEEPPAEVAAPADDWPQSPAPASELVEPSAPTHPPETIPDQTVESPEHGDAGDEPSPTGQSLPSEMKGHETESGEPKASIDDARSSGDELREPAVIRSLLSEQEKTRALHFATGTAQAVPGQKGVAPNESLADTHPASVYHSRTIPKPAYQSAAVLLSILLMALAVYIVRSTAESLRTAWSTYRLASVRTPAGQTTPAPPTPGTGELQTADPVTIRILHKEAQALAGQRRYDECKVLLRRILEIDPANQDAIATLNYVEAASPAPGAGTDADDALHKGLGRVSALISSGKLQTAGKELDRLELSHPNAPEVAAMRRRLETRNSKMMGELAQKEAEKKADRARREESWTRNLAELFAQGKYAEARGALSLWLAEDPTSDRAQEAYLRVEEIQRGLKKAETALEEKRYQDALAALAGVERLNPTDSNLADMQRRIESRKAAARASLTVYPLGDKATLLLDGKKIGNGGEVENESIPIGRHTLSVEDNAGFGVMTSQEFLEGQKGTFVYDIAKQELRPMADADRERLARKKGVDQAYRFAVEHYHGRFRGSCKGELLLSSGEVEYKPASGSHGYRVPIKSLRLRTEGKSLDFSVAMDGKDFQSFRVQDAQAAESFSKVWNSLTSGRR